MRRVVALVMMCGCAAVAGAQGPTARTLIALENDWAHGVVRRDTALFQRMLDPKFVYTEDAAVMGKADVIKSIRDGDRVDRASNSDMLVHDFGGTAVVTGILRLEGRSSTGAFDRRYRFTDTWMRRGGAWRIVAAQDYLIPR
jgi:ketosteroid isomerase-like protein